MRSVVMGRPALLFVVRLILCVYAHRLTPTSWRDSCAVDAVARVEHAPSCHHFCLQEGDEGGPCRLSDCVSAPIDVSNDAEMLALIKTSIGTKFVVRCSGLMCKLDLQAIRTVAQNDAGRTTVDI